MIQQILITISKAPGIELPLGEKELKKNSDFEKCTVFLKGYLYIRILSQLMNSLLTKFSSVLIKMDFLLLHLDFLKKIFNFTFYNFS